MHCGTMLAMVSFLVNPERSATAPDGTQWHIAVVRGNKWRGADWEHHPSFAWNPSGRTPLTHALIEGYLFDRVLWLVYKAGRRNDWRVVLRSSPHVPLTSAALDERYEGKEVAAERATELLRVIRAEGFAAGHRQGLS